MGPSSFHPLFRTRQEAWRPRRGRRCLLKGCERWFTPSHPQVRYCSEACRRRHGSGDVGRPANAIEPAPRQRTTPRPAVPLPTTLSGAAGQANRPPPADTSPSREGQRPASTDENFSTRSCDRPGCYDVSWSRPRWRSGVFARRCAGWRYGACWIARPAIGNGGGVGVETNDPAASAAGHVLSMSFGVGGQSNDRVKCPRPQTEEGAGGHEIDFVPPFPFFGMGGSPRVRHAVGMREWFSRWPWPRWGKAIAAIAWPTRRPRKRWPVRCGVGGSCRRWWRAGGASSWNCSTASSVWRRRGRWPG